MRKRQWKNKTTTLCSTADSVPPPPSLLTYLRNLFCTFAPGVAGLFFRVRDNSILPPRLPICVGSDGVEEEMGSVNWGCGSQIIFGFQLGESFGSVSWKARGRYFLSTPRAQLCHGQSHRLTTPTVGGGEDLQAACDTSENSTQNTLMPSIFRFLWANVVGWCTLTFEFSSSVSSQ